MLKSFSGDGVVGQLDCKVDSLSGRARHKSVGEVLLGNRSNSNTNDIGSNNDGLRKSTATTTKKKAKTLVAGSAGGVRARGKSSGSKEPLKKLGGRLELDPETERMLAEHNKKFRKAPSYVPRVHSGRRYRQVRSLISR